MVFIMDSKVNYAIVGLFVIILNIALVATILWLSVGTEKKDYQTYQVYIQESVSGLNHKAPVKYRGVEVGYVRDVSIVFERPNEVRLLLDIEKGVPLKQDTLALLSVQGLTGLAYIELTGGSLSAQAPVSEIGQPYPELKTKPSLLERLDSAMSTFLKNINNISNTADVLLSEQNQLAVTNILHNLEVVSGTWAARTDTIDSAVMNILHNIQVVTSTLAAHTDNIDVALANVLKTTDNINLISDKVIALLTQLESSLVALENSSFAFAQIAKTIEKTSNAFSKTIDKTNLAVESIDETTKKIGKTAEEIGAAVTKSSKDMDYFTRQALPEVTNTVRELRVLSNRLRHFVQELERKPNMLLFGK